MQLVGILEFVYQNVLEARLVVFTQHFIARQQFVTAQQQLGKIHGTFALALLLVSSVQLNQLAVEVVVRLYLVRTQAVFLIAVDEVLQLLRRIFLVIDVQCFQHPFDQRQLIGRIENLKGFRQCGLTVMGAQQAVAQAVKSADPHATSIDRQHRR